MATNIEWAEESWNPISGCTPISTGCKNCYARRTAEGRLRGRFGYPADEPFRPGVFHRDKIDQPSRWKKPRVIFVCSMSDLWHPAVDPVHRAQVFTAMRDARRHTYLMLTKRPEFIRESFLLERPNTWVGVTIENRTTLPRLESLRLAPVRHRFVSYEPALGPVDWSVLGPHLTGRVEWLIIGCETGPGRRWCALDWIRSAIAQGHEAGAKVFVKQIEVDGCVEKDLAKWPEDLRVREFPDSFPH